MLEVSPSSIAARHPSIGRIRSGDPYANYRALAQRLADGLEDLAQTSEASHERKRLETLAAAARQIEACLTGTGAKL